MGRSRAGRPKEYKDRLTVTTSFEKELYESFQKIAEREGKNINELLQDFMTTYVKKHGEGNSTYTLDKFSDPDFRVFPTVGEPEKWKPFMESCNLQQAEEAKSYVKRINEHIHDRINTITIPISNRLKAEDRIKELKEQPPQILCRYTHKWEVKEIEGVNHAICSRCGKDGGIV